MYEVFFNRIKGKFRKILNFTVAFIFCFSILFPLVPIKLKNEINLSAEGSGTDPSSKHYGIIYANIDEFAYYEYANNWSEFGAGLDVEWSLPAEAKEGDYFTLKLPDEISLSYEPMYREGENVPYDNLMNEPLKYRDVNSNLFFVIRSQENSTNPGVPILNVYYTKKNELTFVAQKYVNDKGAIKGNAIIGRQVNPDDLFAYTDGNGRHVREGSNFDGSGVKGFAVGNERYDLKKGIAPNTILGVNGKSYYLYTGFTPNFSKINEQNGATRVENSSTEYFLHKDIKYVSKYKDYAEIDVHDGGTSSIGTVTTDGVFINYETQMKKWWGYNRNKVSYGKEGLFLIDQDKDYLYYYISYNVNRGYTDPRGGTSITFWADDDNLIVENINDIKMYSGYTDDLNSKTANSIMPWMKYYPDSVVQGKAFYKNRYWYEVRFHDNERYNTYATFFKVRKNKFLLDENKIKHYKIKMQVSDGVQVRNFENRHYPTEGLGGALTTYGKIDYDLSPVFRINKMDNLGNLLRASEQVTSDGKMVYEDVYGTKYTRYDTTFRDEHGNVYNYLKDKDGSYVFEDPFGNRFYKKQDGGVEYYLDQYGVRYDKKDDGSFVTTKHVDENIFEYSIGRIPNTTNRYRYEYVLNGESLTVDYDAYVNNEAEHYGLEVMRDEKGNVYKARIQNSDNDPTGTYDLITELTVNGVKVDLKNTKQGVYAYKTPNIEEQGTEKVFYPTRPVLTHQEAKVTVEYIKSGNTLVDIKFRNGYGYEFEPVEQVDNYSNGKVTGSTIKLQDRNNNVIKVVVDVNGNVLNFLNLSDNTVKNSLVQNLGNTKTYKLETTFYGDPVKPSYNDPFVFRIVDNVTKDVFEHNINEFGYAMFPSLIKGHTYTLEEVKASKGYDKLKDSYTLAISKDGKVTITDKDGTLVTKDTKPLYVKDENFSTYALENDSKAKIIIKKVDDKDSVVESSKAVFKLYKEGDYELKDGKFVPKEGAKFTLVETVQSINGQEKYGISEKISIPPKKGKFILVEEKAPDGFSKLEDVIELELFEENDEFKWRLLKANDKLEVENDAITIKVKNVKDDKVFALKIFKKDADTSNTTQLNARFELYRGKLVDGKVVADENAKVGQGNTNTNDGLFFKSTKGSEITKGLYVLREVKAPSEYIKLSEDIPFSIDKDGNMKLESTSESLTKLVSLEKSDEKFEDKLVLKVTVKNKKAVYPSAGGKGILLYLVVGLSLMSISYLGIRKLRKVK